MPLPNQRVKVHCFAVVLSFLAGISVIRNAYIVKEEAPIQTIPNIPQGEAIYAARIDVPVCVDHLTANSARHDGGGKGS